jgi:hypothetical protein
MMTVQKISFYQLPEAIEESYRGDNALFEKFHIAPNMTLKQCVMETMKMIYATSKQYPMEYYKIISEKKCIGYIAIFPKFLYSFALNIKSRTKENKTQLWNLIKGLLGEYFCCSLLNNNHRAIKWLQEMKMETIMVDNQNYITVLANKKKQDSKSIKLEDQCQS